VLIVNDTAVHVSDISALRVVLNFEKVCDPLDELLLLAFRGPQG
jgi:hypothetical protein